MAKLVVKMTKDNEEIDKFTEKRWKMMIDDRANDVKKEEKIQDTNTSRSIEPYYVFQNLISWIDNQ